MRAKNGYCPYDGRKATWPSYEPMFCTMRCAAERCMTSFRMGNEEGWTWCAGCGHKEVPCENPKCDDPANPESWD